MQKPRSSGPWRAAAFGRRFRMPQSSRSARSRKQSRGVGGRRRRYGRKERQYRFEQFEQRFMLAVSAFAAEGLEQATLVISEGDDLYF